MTHSPYSASRSRSIPHFPILDSDLVYLDSAASSLTPEPVIRAMDEYYRGYRSNVHRGLYPESERATEEYEAVRGKVAAFIGVPGEIAANGAAGSGHSGANEIIFTSGATAALNMIARMAAQKLEQGDEILVSAYEHHSNIIPWQIIAAEKGLRVRMVRPQPGTFALTPHDIENALTPRTKVVALTHISNVTGYTLPIAEIAPVVKAHGALFIVDGCQSVPHIKVDVAALGCDAFVFSGHKMFGPTGVGVLWVRKELLATFEPVFGGGGIVDDVDVDRSVWNDIPHRFEPGTPPIAEVLGLGIAIEFIDAALGGMENVMQQNAEMYSYALSALQRIPGVVVAGHTNPADASNANTDATPLKYHGALSFSINGIHAHDIASFLAERRIAVRAGHHCAQPLMRYLRVSSLVRLSIQTYTTTDDIDTAAQAIRDAIKIFTLGTEAA